MYYVYNLQNTIAIVRSQKFHAKLSVSQLLRSSLRIILSLGVVNHALQCSQMMLISNPIICMYMYATLSQLIYFMTLMIVYLNNLRPDNSTILDLISLYLQCNLVELGTGR